MTGDFGELLRAFRRRTGWSQEALAERSGMSARTISVLESGRRPPRLSSAALLADALDLEAADRERLLATAVGADNEAALQPANPVGAMAAVGEVLRQLPADLRTFTGRDAEVKELLESATAAGVGAETVSISAIEGMGGVGKTRLAVRVAHELARSGRCADAQLYVSLRGFDPDQVPADPGDLLESLLRQLAVPPADIPPDTGGRAALFRHRMHGRDAVLILDDAADARQVRHLIPASPTCRVLITSRRTLTEIEGAAWHHLGVFSEQEALELLARIAGEERVAAEPEAASRIVRQCGLLPLAVSVTAARLRSRPVWSLADLAGRLEREDATTSDIGGATFDVSYRDLPDRARGLFRLLGIHPALDFTAASVAAPAGLTPIEADRVLELLLDENLVLQCVAGRYRIHDLLRAYAAERAEAEMPQDERRTAVETVLRWFVAVLMLTASAVGSEGVVPSVGSGASAGAGVGAASGATPQAASVAEAARWYSRERPNLMRAVAIAGRMGFDSLARRLPIAMAYFEELAQN